METINFAYLIYAAILVVAFVLGQISKSLIPSYFSEKGKGLATKEDIEEITHKVESVKADIGSKLAISQQRYKKEFEVFANLAAAAVDLKDAASLISPTIDTAPNGETSEQRKERRISKYRECLLAFYNIVEKQRPFYPEQIYQLGLTLDKLAWSMIIVASRNQSNPNYWDDIEAKANELKSNVEEIVEAIRQRIKSWEDLL